MSKLEEQKALPRRKLFRTTDPVGEEIRRSLERIRSIVSPSPKRKAKKAKRK